MNEIRILRQQHGYSLEAAAKQVGISTGYMSQIESGKRHVSSDLAEKIATLYDTKREELFTATRYKLSNLG
ncbi:helix-turn-helix transcriptional regulator [Shouchella shacheensis]|uniref:helix-turn-helix transcriptional regulator n=1 Tax=Shouchella shacheensis TaxID=1649580 RepID=UPI00073FBC89|nr:helix-turn-helix transcriptional regulator [Shouchella shacheensis]